MTDDTQPLIVQPEQGTRLEQLHAAYADAKARADDAAAALKAITDGLKVELTNAAPEGTPVVELRGTDGPSLRVTWTTSWRLDSKRLKADDPETWVRYAKQSGTWVLKAVKAGDEE